MHHIRICSNSIFLYIICSASAYAAENNSGRFDPAFINGSVSSIADLSIIENGGVPPGEYDVDLYINGEFFEVKRIVFYESNSNGKTSIVPVFEPSDLERYGLKREYYASGVLTNSRLIDISQITGITQRFNASQQRLELSIPQAMMNTKPNGYVSEERWDDGINAALLDYNVNYYKNNSNENHADNVFLNLNGGVNIGPWRYREYTTGSYAENSSGMKWSTFSRYVMRPLRSMHSTLTIGDNNTSGDMFESISSRSITLESDDSMMPSSIQNFAPIVRGVARTNAVVTVYQNGYPIYETNVSPGAFELKDVSPVSNSGELTVKIKESDGRVNQFVIPYSAIPLLIREGAFKYKLTAGKAKSLGDDAPMAQGSMSYGLRSDMTIYGGAQVADGYHAFLGGAGFDLGYVGAVSFDVTTAKSVGNNGQANNGQSYRFLYSKSIENTGTSLQLAGYRYSTLGFRTLNEHLNEATEVNSLSEESNVQTVNRSTKKSNFQINISQNINERNSIFITGSKSAYWGGGEDETLYQLGHSTSFGSVSVNTFIGYNQGASNDVADKSISLSLSVPFSIFGSNRNGSMSSATSYNGKEVSQMFGVGGTVGENNQFQYNAYDTYDFGLKRNQSTLNSTYKGERGIISMGYSHSDSSKQMNANVHGGVVVHSNGLTLSQPLGETNILVEAEGADGLKIASGDNVVTDRSGYAIIPSATVYRENSIALDSTSWNDDVEVDSVVRKVIPSRGAVVKASFPVKIGNKALITITQNGNKLPFGTTVRVVGNASHEYSIVDEYGQVFLSALNKKGKLMASWAKGGSCTADYSIPNEKVNAGIYFIKAKCS